jgi:hypothetical protein
MAKKKPIGSAPIDYRQSKMLTNRKGVRKNPDGTVSTHIMANADNYAFPTLFQNSDNSWLEMDFDKAFDEANKRGELYKFSSPEEAAKFAEGSWKEYSKGGWLDKYEDGGTTPEFEPTLKLFTDKAEYDKAFKMYSDSLLLNQEMFEGESEAGGAAYNRLTAANKEKPGEDADGLSVSRFPNPRMKPVFKEVYKDVEPKEITEKAAAAAKAKADGAEIKAKQEKFSSIEGSVLPVVMAEDTTDLRGYKFRTKYGEKFVPIEDKDTLNKYINLYGLELPAKAKGGNVPSSSKNTYNNWLDKL